ncbi:hypothetical protein F4781DRAFT_293797 [Annulohypoxylon bovei var. microspora]|nr:hypothetical protein F4781DRAFT_293797 [Annulohypoxylon bovei var. microspora]
MKVGEADLCTHKIHIISKRGSEGKCEGANRCSTAVQGSNATHYTSTRAMTEFYAFGSFVLLIPPLPSLSRHSTTSPLLLIRAQSGQQGSPRAKKDYWTGGHMPGPGSTPLRPQFSIGLKRQSSWRRISHIGSRPIFIKCGVSNWTKNCFDSSGVHECRDYHVLSVTARLAIKLTSTSITQLHWSDTVHTPRTLCLPSLALFWASSTSSNL